MADGPTQPLFPTGVTQTQTGLPNTVAANIAQIIPGYEILGEIHRGGQGVVFLAFQKSTKRLVAIKIPRSAASAGPGELARFQSEVEILAQLKHPHIVTIYDSGIATDGSVYFVMDYIEGQPLDDLPLDTSAPESWGPFLRRFASICEAVGAAHDRGIVHCDLKPGNILVDPEGQPRILDFGLATVALREEQDADRHGFFGSLPWASPEQAAGQPLSFPTDVYSLGMILFRLLTGSFPFDATGEKPQVLDRIIHMPTVAPRANNRVIDRDLNAIIRKCLDRDPTRRYPTAAALAKDWHRYLSFQPLDARSHLPGYRAARHCSRFLRRRPIFLHASGIAMFSTLAFWVTGAIHSTFPELDRTFRRTALKFAASPTEIEKAMDCVRVIAITPETNIQVISAREGLDGVSATVPKSLRRMHGRLLERLAEASPRAVALDLYFPDVTPFDEDFVKGVRALRAKNIDVVVGVQSWKLDEHGLPELSTTILPEVRWGCIRADFGGRAPWALELCLLRRGREPRPCFGLVAAAAYIEPSDEVSIQVLEEEAVCELQYWRPNVKTARAQEWSKRRDRIPFSGVGGGTTPLLPAADIQPGDRLTFYMIMMPSNQLLAHRTLEYGSVFETPLATLRHEFAGRLVLIADQRKNPDWHAYPDGRTISGSYGQAVGIDSLLGHMAFGMPPQAAAVGGLLISAFFGSFIGIRMARNLIRRLVAFFLLTVSLIVLSVLMCRLAGYLCNPTIAILAALGCCEWAAFWARRPSSIRDNS